MLYMNVQSILLITTQLLSTFLLVAFLHNSIIIVFIMYIGNDEWSLYKLHKHSVAKYWEWCRLAICLQLGCTNACILPELLFAKAALPKGLSVEQDGLASASFASVCKICCYIAYGCYFIIAHKTFQYCQKLKQFSWHHKVIYVVFGGSS